MNQTLDYPTPSSERSATARDLTWAISGAALGLMITPLGVGAASVSAGADDGNLAVANVLFPFAVFLMRVSPWAACIGIVQFPAYGFMVGLVSGWKRRTALAFAITAMHSVAVAVCFTRF